jgi:chorismate-pyruvate lyase
LLALALTLVGSASVMADAAEMTPGMAASWPDNFQTRVQALALLQSLNADLLSHDSATLTLERWCGAHALAPQAQLLAHQVHGPDKPLPADLRAELGIGADEPVHYRRVQLACGEHVLSEADNWYVPSRLTAAMNQQLETTDTPFGKVVMPLKFRRKTLSAQLLWSPLPSGWEMQPPPRPGNGPLMIPAQVLQHRAVLYTGSDQPFSALVETYTDQVLAFALDGARG